MPHPRPEDLEEEMEAAMGDEGNPEEDGKVKVYWTNYVVAEAWEKSTILRKRGRETKQLTRWPAAKTKGIPSMQAIHLNGDALLILAKRWCPLVPMAKTPTIEVLQTEVKKWREEMDLQEDSVIEYLDTWGLRRMFSLAIRRRSSSRRSRDTVVEEFFDVLLRHWGHTKQYLAKHEGLAEEADDILSDGYVEMSDNEDASWCVKFRDAGGSSESLPDEGLEDSVGSNEVAEEIPEPGQVESTMHGGSSDSLGSDKVPEEIPEPLEVEPTMQIDMDGDEDLAVEEALLLKQLAVLQAKLQAPVAACPDNLETQIEALQTPEPLAALSRSNSSFADLEDVLPGKHFSPAVELPSTSATSEPDSAFVTPSPKCLLPDLADVATPPKTEAPVVAATATADAPKNGPSVEASEAKGAETDDEIMNYEGFASRKDQTGIKRKNKEVAEAKAKPGGRGRGGRGGRGRGAVEPRHDDEDDDASKACAGRGRGGGRGRGRGKGETSCPVEDEDREDLWGDEGAKPKKKKKQANPKPKNKKIETDDTKASKEKPAKRVKVAKATAEPTAAVAGDDDHEAEWHDGEATCYYDLDDPWWHDGGAAEQKGGAAAWEAWWDDCGHALYGAQEADEAKSEPEQEQEEVAVGPEPSFARRPPPKTEVPYRRWSAVRDAFKTHVSPSVLYSCKYQDPFWKVCMEKFGDRKDELNRGLVDFATIATKAAKHFAKSQAFPAFLCVPFSGTGEVHMIFTEALIGWGAIVDVMPPKGIRKGQAFLARLWMCLVAYAVQPLAAESPFRNNMLALQFEFLIVVLLVSWTSYIDLEPQRPFELLEFFAGHATIARAAEVAGYRSAAVDILYDEARQERKSIGKRSPFDLNSACCGNGAPGHLVTGGMLLWNMLTVLLMALAVAMGGSVFLENPAQSVLFDCKWFLWLVRAMKSTGHGTSRKNLEKIMASVGYNPEAFVQLLEEIHESYTESELEIQGEYATEETMAEKRIDAVKAYCAQDPGRFMRRDTYEQDKVLYWCEKTIKASHKQGERSIRRSTSTFEANGVAGPSEPSVCPIVDPAASPSLTQADLGSVDDKDASDLRKRAGIPEFNPDARPSAVAVKMTVCLSKRSQKLLDVKKQFDAIDKNDYTENHKRKLSLTNPNTPTKPLNPDTYNSLIRN
ncbi:unnamed protein product [Symbiodinium sp. CCMP2592]|nr:unnamed protein product [Symbiodinium sp. CCMP2592]